MSGRLVALLALLSAGLFASFCIVILDQREVAFRTLINKPVQEFVGLQLNQPVLDEPGLYVRIPGLHQLYRYDARLHDYSADSQEAYTSGKDLITVDYYAIWQIADPQLFYEAFRSDMSQARGRIDNTTYSRLRNTLARYAMSDLLSERRDEITAKITEDSNAELAPQGIRVTDLQIRALDYPDRNLEQIYRRMRTERERFGTRFRAEGSEQALAIRAKADEESQVVRAEADREAAKLRGDGDAEAAQIYGDAYGQDPEFYSFVRSLEAYSTSLDGQTTLILSRELPFLRYLFEGGPAPAAASAPSRSAPRPALPPAPAPAPVEPPVSATPQSD